MSHMARVTQLLIFPHSHTCTYGTRTLANHSLPHSLFRDTGHHTIGNIHPYVPEQSEICCHNPHKRKFTLLIQHVVHVEHYCNRRFTQILWSFSCRAQIATVSITPNQNRHRLTPAHCATVKGGCWPCQKAGHRPLFPQDVLACLYRQAYRYPRTV